MINNPAIGVTPFQETSMCSLNWMIEGATPMAGLPRFVFLFRIQIDTLKTNTSTPHSMS